MVKLAVQIITRNNQNQIESAIKSVYKLGCDIIIADLGSSDGTVDICKACGIEVLSFPEWDRSIVRNKLVDYCDSTWNFYIEPWEIILKGHGEILDICQNSRSSSYYVQVFQGENVLKQIRLWKKGLKFKNPIFECIYDKSTDYSDIVLVAGDYFQDYKNEIHLWKSHEPLAVEPYYYESCILLSQRNYNDFLRISEQFLFHQSKQLMPTIMTRYYRAIVYARNKREPEQAIRNLIPCLISQPLMAEYWCLLGDIYYHLLKQYSKAIIFYKNAIDLGKNRPKNDSWPIEIEKYYDYPNKMILCCESKLKRIEYYHNSSKD
jgi:tetratricopeptide (TPR) repeat protein